MMVDVYNKENSKVGKIEVPEEIFKVKWNPVLVHQALVAQLANQRHPLAHSKTRGEVRGGGRKPWRQKGTGHARHGSIRSPLWIGGGVTFGPRKEKVFAKKINRKMKQGALFSLLSKKLGDQEIKIIDDLSITEPKTKKVVEILKKIFEKPASAIFIVANNKNFFIAARNIRRVAVVRANSLDVYNLLTHRYVFIEKEAVEDLVKIYLPRQIYKK